MSKIILIGILLNLVVVAQADSIKATVVKPTKTPVATPTPSPAYPYPYYIMGVFTDQFGNPRRDYYSTVNGAPMPPTPPYVEWTTPTTATIHLCPAGYKAKVVVDTADTSSMNLTCITTK